MGSIILFVVCAVLAGAINVKLGGETDYEEDNKDVGRVVRLWTVLIVVLTSMAAGTFTAQDVGYKRGQVDAINGNIKYELVEKEDKTVVWEKITIER